MIPLEIKFSMFYHLFKPQKSKSRHNIKQISNCSSRFGKSSITRGLVVQVGSNGSLTIGKVFRSCFNTILFHIEKIPQFYYKKRYYQLR